METHKRVQIANIILRKSKARDIILLISNYITKHSSLNSMVQKAFKTYKHTTYKNRHINPVEHEKSPEKKITLTWQLIYKRGGARIYSVEKYHTFLIVVLGKLDSYLQKNEAGLFSHIGQNGLKT